MHLNSEEYYRENISRLSAQKQYDRLRADLAACQKERDDAVEEAKSWEAGYNEQSHVLAACQKERDEARKWLDEQEQRDIKRVNLLRDDLAASEHRNAVLVEALETCLGIFDGSDENVAGLVYSGGGVYETIRSALAAQRTEQEGSE